MSQSCWHPHTSDFYSRVLQSVSVGTFFTILPTVDVLSFALPPPIAISLAVVILTALVIRSRARRLGAEKKKRYHPYSLKFLRHPHQLPQAAPLRDPMTEFAHKHKTYRAYNVFIDNVVTTDPADVEYILKTNFANYGKVCCLTR